MLTIIHPLRFGEHFRQQLMSEKIGLRLVDGGLEEFQVPPHWEHSLCHHFHLNYL